jgi:hypothetical protein
MPVVRDDGTRSGREIRTARGRVTFR